MKNSLIKINCKDLLENKKQKNKVQVFYFRQHNHYNSVDSLYLLLSEEEKKRAKAFRFENDKLNYITCHGILRKILSKETGKKPENLSFLNDKNNKPYLNRYNIFFNISHTKEMCAIAISEENELGIDIEKIKENKYYKDIAEKHFTIEELAFLSVSENPLKDFYLIWTRKEAFLKNTGTGIKAGLKNINVGEKINYIDSEPILKYSDIKTDNDFSIYSCEIEDHIISIAVSGEALIELIPFPSDNRF
ncbi:MAG: 4'-phosphopantetheinyl transferase superfamily protein [Prolixibacteraceae bacterium]|nr:4'-phosphopantetheinyl transferase superfamily protein [Prolixibacteraceae bacterium]MBN2772999.1 4'-phosphopantetheinyl transferase superfamily protein [Prolixibacteraceae bacterium]